MQNYFFLLDFSMRKFIKIQFDLGVPAIAVGLSAISLLAKLGTESGTGNWKWYQIPSPKLVPDIRSQRMPLQSLTQSLSHQVSESPSQLFIVNCQLLIVN